MGYVRAPSGRRRWQLRDARAVCACLLLALILLLPHTALASTAYVTDSVFGMVTPIDLASGVPKPPILVKGAPRAVAVSPDGSTVYVVSSDPDVLTPIDSASGTPGATIPVGALPQAVAVAPDGNSVYVADANANAVTPIDVSKGTAGAPIAVGTGPMGIAFAPDGRTAYVADQGSDDVTPIDVASGRTGTAIPVADGPTSIAVTPDGTKAYATDHTAATVTPIDLATKQAQTPIPVDGIPDQIAIAPDGQTAYVTLTSQDSVQPIDLATGKAGTPIPVGQLPVGVAFSPDGRTVYVTNAGFETVSPINVATGTTGSDILAAGDPTSVAFTPDQPPTAAFLASPGAAGSATSFDASSSLDPDGTVATYSWTFGDGSSAVSTTPVTTHIYRSPGTYAVTLTVADSAGCGTTLVFTGQTAACNGSPAATVSHTVGIQQAVASSPPATTPAVASSPPPSAPAASLTARPTSTATVPTPSPASTSPPATTPSRTSTSPPATILSRTSTSPPATTPSPPPTTPSSSSATSPPARVLTATSPRPTLNSHKAPRHVTHPRHKHVRRSARHESGHRPTRTTGRRPTARSTGTVTSPAVRVRRPPSGSGPGSGSGSTSVGGGTPPAAGLRRAVPAGGTSSTAARHRRFGVTPAGARHRRATGQRSAAAHGNPRRPLFASFLRRPDNLLLSPAEIARSLGAAVLLLALLGLPARLFNMTVKANRRQLAAWVGRALRTLGAPARLAPERFRMLLRVSATSVVTAAIVHAFLSPGFPTRPGSGALVLGMLLGWTVVVANTVVTWRWYQRRNLPELAARWHVYPGQAAFCVFCVAVSRLAHFVPGLIMGMTGDCEWSSEVELEHHANRVVITDTALAIISLAAWAGSIPVGNAAAHPGASFAVLTLDAALSVTAVAGMEILAFTLIPLRFLDGYALCRYRQKAWLVLWGSGVLWFSLVILTPALSAPEAHSRASATWLAVLLGLELAIAFTVWSYFTTQRRATRTTPG